MYTTIRQREFLDSAEAAEILRHLQSMETDPSYNTQTPFALSSSEQISFCDKHMTYLSLHRKVDPQQYLSNLRLKTRVR